MLRKFSLGFAAMNVAPVSEQIRQALEAEGISQSELADRMHIDPSVVSKLVNGKASLSKGMYASLVASLRSIRPVDLLRAMGWAVPLGAAANVPPALAEDVDRMNERGVVILSGVATSLRQTHPRQ
jgi:transcriptional regulator with XRE-family HTH domain